MKNAICMFLGLFILTNSFGQEKVPAVVLTAFSDREPFAEDVFWEFREDAFVGMFSDVEGLKKMFFDQTGEWLETRTRIARTALPIRVTAFINQHYGTADITYIGRVDEPKRTLYRIESELASAVVIKLLDEQGTLLDENRIEWNFSKPAVMPLLSGEER